MIKKYTNFSKLISILAIASIVFVGCSTITELPKNNTKIIEAATKLENTSDNKIEIKSDISDLTAEEAYEIAAKTVKDYFNFDADKSAFKPENIIDMGHYWIVNVSNNEGRLDVRILLEDKKPFFIEGSSSAENKLIEEYKKSKGVKEIDMEEYLKYYYSKKPASKKESKKIAEDFIKSTPLKDLNLKFLESESFYELKYDSPEKEYFVFAYLKDDKDPKNPQNIVFIKVNTYTKEVREVSF